MASPMNFPKHLKSEELSQTIAKKKIEGKLPDSFWEASVTLIANQTHSEKRATSPYPDEHRRRDPQQLLANPIQQDTERAAHPK